MFVAKEKFDDGEVSLNKGDEYKGKFSKERLAEGLIEEVKSEPKVKEEKKAKDAKE